ncbi:MAG: SgcJ/EcaC family oxidoreductase, partial [Rhodothermia bacterium]|nr:SgcJ/EcaC family oxidoreductase [Rhodothermia bacterium]
MRVLTALLFGLLVTLAVPATAQYSDTETAIRAGSQKWAAAWNAGDAKALAALYAEDAVAMAPGSEPAKGRAAIEEHFRSSLDAAKGTENVIKTREVMDAGDWAVEVGSFVANSADGEHLDHGPYMALW